MKKQIEREIGGIARERERDEVTCQLVQWNWFVGIATVRKPWIFIAIVHQPCLGSQNVLLITKLLDLHSSIHREEKNSPQSPWMITFEFQSLLFLTLILIPSLYIFLITPLKINHKPHNIIVAHIIYFFLFFYHLFFRHVTCPRTCGCCIHEEKKIIVVV